MLDVQCHERGALLMIARKLSSTPDLFEQRLKQKLSSRFPSQVYEYTCRVLGVDESTGRRRVQLGDFNGFSDNVLNFLKTAIERSYPRSDNPEEVNENEEGWR